MSWSQSFNDPLPLLINCSSLTSNASSHNKRLKTISSSPTQEWMERLSNSQEESFFSSTTNESNNSLFAFSEEIDELFDSFQHFCPLTPAFGYPTEIQNEDDEFDYNMEETLSSFLNGESGLLESVLQDDSDDDLSTEDDKYISNRKNLKKQKKLPLQYFHNLSEVKESINKVHHDTDTPTPVLWIGNVGTQVSEEELLSAFGQFGNVVNIRILREKYCGFVTFDNATSASSAKFHLHHKVFGDQAIVINYKRTPSNPIDISVVTNPPCNSLWVGNIHDECTRYDLEKEFMRFGRIESVRILRNCAFVNFHTVEEAAYALEMLQGKKFGSMYLKINYAKQRGSQQHDQSNYPSGFYTSPTYPTSSLSTSPFNHSPNDPSPPSQSYLLTNTHPFQSNTMNLASEWY